MRTVTFQRSGGFDGAKYSLLLRPLDKLAFDSYVNRLSVKLQIIEKVASAAISSEFC